MPVPGTCSYAGWEGLPNGSRWGVVPVSAKNKAGEWMTRLVDDACIFLNRPGFAAGAGCALHTAALIPETVLLTHDERVRRCALALGLPLLPPS